MVDRAYGDGRYLVEIVPNLGKAGNNAYILSGPSRGKVTIIDAPDGAAILEAVGRRTIERIVITHEADENLEGLAALRKATEAPIYAGVENAKTGTVRQLKHGDTFDIGGATARILATPGQTPGAFSFHFGGSVLTGNTLADGAPADANQKKESIKTHLLQLQPDTVVLPAQGTATTVAKLGEAQK